VKKRAIAKRQLVSDQEFLEIVRELTDRVPATPNV
jgi:hypothetical protein